MAVAAQFQAHLRAFFPTLHDEGELEDAICWLLSTFCSISSMADSRCHSRRVCVLSVHVQECGGEEGGVREGIRNLIQLFWYGRRGDTLRVAHLRRIIGLGLGLGSGRRRLGLPGHGHGLPGPAGAE